MIAKYKLAIQIGAAVAVVVALVLLGALPAWHYQQARWDKDVADIRTAHAEAYALAQAQARSEEQRRQSAIEGIRRDAKQKIIELQSDVATAERAADGLRGELAERTRRAVADTCAAGGGETAKSTLILYSELLDRADRRAGELAAFADRAHAAGGACEGAYESLMLGLVD
tara:strand:+ start:6242 stop:6754 length:513 start_codon:yes stop_codon:yes gene_type:complete